MVAESQSRSRGARARLEARRRAQQRAHQRQESRTQRGGVSLWWADIAFYWRRNSWSRLPILLAAPIAILVFFAHFTLGGRIYPAVYSLGQALGGMGREAANEALVTAWSAQPPLQIFIDGRSVAEASPEALGMRLDANATFERARRVGLAGLPFGYHITPVITIDDGDYWKAQQFLLDFKQQVDIPPANASYRYVQGEMQPLPGQEGQTLDIMSALTTLAEYPAKVLQQGQLRMETTIIKPVVTDPMPLLNEAQAIVQQGIELIGYDPYTNETTRFSASPADVANWLQAGPETLQLQEERFRAMIYAINVEQLLRDEGARFLDANYAYRKVNDALARGETRVNLRINYRPSIYTIENGDTAYDISRKTGIPYGLIAEANPGRDLNTLFVGDEIQLPTRDITIPNDVIPHKRIIVDLDQQHLIAYENGEVIFDWGISSGMPSDPTLPGVFQILSHSEVAKGSSFRLCNDEQCGSWEMNFFMGIYEVRPGLMNGLHGAVLLPNGYYLNGNNVSEPSTLGCVMSENSNAEKLYEWADVGTIVEIVGDDYEPQSDLARHALRIIQSHYAT